MPAILVLLFVIVPIVEIVVIIQVGQVIGAWWTVVLLVVDSLLGAWLLRREGARTWKAFRRALDEGRWPGDEVAQGAMVIVGGTLLLTPGFVTDVVGFILLIPVSRRVLSRTVRARFREKVIGDTPAGRGPGTRDRRRVPGSRNTRNTFDVEVVDIRREDGPEPSHGPGELDSDSGRASNEDTGGDEQARGSG